MNWLQRVCAATVVLSLLSAAAWAAERAGAVPKSTLNSMGFATAKVISDAEGQTVRGRGRFAFVFSRASVGGISQTRTDFAPPGHTAATGTFLFGGSGFAGGGAFAFAR